MTSLALLFASFLLSVQETPSQEMIRGLIRTLGSASIEEREAATVKLRSMGKAAVFELEKAVESRDLEVAMRVGYLVGLIPLMDRFVAHRDRSDPGNGNSHYRLGDYCKSIGLYEQAFFEYREASRLDPSLMKKVALAREALGTGMLATARRCHETGDQKRAKQILDSLWEVLPKCEAMTEAKKLQLAIASAQAPQNGLQILISELDFDPSDITFTIIPERETIELVEWASSDITFTIITDPETIKVDGKKEK